MNAAAPGVKDSGKKVLVIEDSDSDAAFLCDFLTEKGFEITRASTLSACFRVLKNESFDAALLDLSLPDSFGIETVESFLKQAPTVPCIVLTGLKDYDLGIRAIKMGVQDYFTKNFEDLRPLTLALQFCIERAQLLWRQDLALNSFDSIKTEGNAPDFCLDFESLRSIYEQMLLEAKRDEKQVAVFRVRMSAPLGQPADSDPMPCIASIAERLKGLRFETYFNSDHLFVFLDFQNEDSLLGRLLSLRDCIEHTVIAADPAGQWSTSFDLRVYPHTPKELSSIFYNDGRTQELLSAASTDRDAAAQEEPPWIRPVFEEVIASSNRTLIGYAINRIQNLAPSLSSELTYLRNSLVEMRRKIKGKRDLRIFIPIDLKALLHPKTLYFLAEQLREHSDFRSKLFHFEVDHKALRYLSDHDHLQMSALRSLGFKICISQVDLQSFSLKTIFWADTYLKIHPRLVAKMASDGSSLKMVKTIITISHDLKRQVIASGVQSPELMDALHSMGCDLLQGVSTQQVRVS